MDIKNMIPVHYKNEVIGYVKPDDVSQIHVTDRESMETIEYIMGNQNFLIPTSLVGIIVNEEYEDKKLVKVNITKTDPIRRITLCGSTKYKKEFNDVNLALTMEGCIVYSVAAFGHADVMNFTDEDKVILDEVHKRKIDNSDEIMVIDVDNYIGSSTKSEIEYAEANGKVVYYASIAFPEIIKI